VLAEMRGGSIDELIRSTTCTPWPAVQHGHTLFIDDRTSQSGMLALDQLKQGENRFGREHEGLTNTTPATKRRC
jgi:hypothetical protein